MKVKVDTLFTDFMHERFMETNGLKEESGWMMDLPSGKQVTRSFLMRQADIIVKLGVDAVPELFKWIMNDQLYIRYIAVYSLQQLTGISPNIPYFDKEDRSMNRQKAIKIWNEWWDKQKEKK